MVRARGAICPASAARGCCNGGCGAAHRWSRCRGDCCRRGDIIIIIFSGTRSRCIGGYVGRVIFYGGGRGGVKVRLSVVSGLLQLEG